ncbi:N-formylglutamate amidohydrolase [Evansella sp. AB-P1]|uniref:N-formylglutamate amidohydrolase n=1 Tax=Evansella sp. AB-P1 TaxID=3037653 RepID=UPI0024202921|nr:N-formylglutamate amidohydrolase [Evansella sp. AB-P1]MDG5785857.1 N-formylglutamate amidohydrolase [Evansella sp. AB-P1]
MKKLPIVISVPHGGMEIPSNLLSKFLMNEKELLLDSDTWTKDLFNFQKEVEEYIDTDIARIVIDMNRDPNDLPPLNPDGVVKTVAVSGKSVWNSPFGLAREEINILMKDFYIPYHKKLRIASMNPNTALGIDCHSMLDIGPSKNGIVWEKRPLFCISNKGSVVNGEQLDQPITATPDLMLQFKILLEFHFSYLIKEIEDEQAISVENLENQLEHSKAEGNRNMENDITAISGLRNKSEFTIPFVTINDPFSGGYITKYHGTQGTIPWIQLEINRSVYLPKAPLPSIIPSKNDLIKIGEVRKRLYRVFQDLSEYIIGTKIR